MTKKLYKFLRTGLKSNYGKHKWKMNKWYKQNGNLEMCGNGFHASKQIQQAFSWVQGEWLCIVEIRGNFLDDTSKQCWEEMKLVEKYRWTKKDSVALAIFAAELVIDNFEKEYPEDKRPREAIEAAKKWLKNPVAKNESAAWSAAENAAWSAAWSAWSAARSAAESAARSAGNAAWSARNAARSAGSAVGSAAESAVNQEIENWFQSWLKEKRGI